MGKYEKEEKWPINAEQVFGKYTWKIVRQFSLVFSEYCTRLWYSLGSSSEHADPSLKHSRQSLSMVNECGNTEWSKTKQMVITTMQGREI